jgi:hypothetical protein
MSEVSEPPNRGHATTDLDGVEVGTRVRLPRGAEPPIRVYINGIEQIEGSDYDLDSEGVLFRHPIIKEGKLGGLRWLSMAIGLFGSYRKNETVDLSYQLDGKTQHATDMPVTKD